MKDTKQRLCLAAISLFNERGYDNTSLRDIAEAAGTTIGNLTYHFPHKEELIAEIQEELHFDFFHLFPVKGTGGWLEAMIRSFKQAELNQQENLFYYRSYIKLCADSSVIRDNNRTFRERLYKQYCECFYELKLQGKMRVDLKEEEYESLSYMLICIIPLWNQMRSLYDDQNLPDVSMSERLCRMLLPYMAEGEREHYIQLCAKICDVKL